ncbi:MAG: LpxI family protein [Paracoccaceae bacterium]
MTLALICGTGALPRAVAAAQDAMPMICVLDGFPPLELRADLTFRLETLGSLLRTLKVRGVTELCLCGGITRPVIDPNKIDAATQPFVPALRGALSAGDDGALRVVMEIFESAGFTMRSATDLAPDILPAPGVLSLAQPGAGARSDVQNALMVLAEMGAQDLGQACVVRHAETVAREDIRGTDAMLADVGLGHLQTPDAGLIGGSLDALGQVLGDAADWLSNASATAYNGILFKAPKPGQDRRADVPTIGPETALGAVRAGLSGIVIEAGGVIVLDLQRTLAILDEAGMFLWVRAR